MKTAEIDIDHIADDPNDGLQLNIQTKSMSWLNENGFPTDVVGGYSVISDSDSGYLVLEVETLQKPIKQADAVEDETTIYVCTCPHFRYRCVPDEITNLKQIQSCKHILKAVRTEQAVNDDSQQTL